MNLETHISPALWTAVRSTYESRNFTGAILDAIYVVTEVLREKADSHADGVALVSQALSGANPVVKVAPLRTESDRNEQRGLEQMLRGIYQGIRNPRSHGKRADSEEDANAIILFLDYILRRLGEAKTLFSKDEFLERVFDSHFPKTERYAELLVEEIPSKYLLEVFHDIYQRREDADSQVLRLVFGALLARLTEDEKPEVWSTISTDLRTASGFDAVKTVFQMLEAPQWSNLSEVARLRIENRIIQEIQIGRYDKKTKKCRSGALATWCTSMFPYFTLKDDLASALMSSLAASDRQQSDYVFEFFLSALIDLVGMTNTRLRRIIVMKLNAGDMRFRNALASPFDDDVDEAWGEQVAEAVSQFQAKSFESPFDADDDDLPF